MNLLNKYILLYPTVFILIYSCSSHTLYNYTEYVRNTQSVFDNNTKTDSLMLSFLSFRDKEVISFLNQRKLKKYLLEEDFYYEHIAGSRAYQATITTSDSIYSFNTLRTPRFRARELEQKNIRNGGCFVYTFKNDSLLINRGLNISMENTRCQNIESYFSGYTVHFNGKNYDLLMENENIIFKNKNSKLNIDFDTEVFFTPEGFCTEKNNIVQCGNVKRKCIKNEKGFYIHCDTIK